MYCKLNSYVCFLFYINYRGSKIASTRRRSGARREWQRGALPGNAPGRGENHSQEDSARFQAGRLRLRFAPHPRRLVRVRRERIQLCEELAQVLRRLLVHTGADDSQGHCAPAPHTTIAAENEFNDMARMRSTIYGN